MSDGGLRDILFPVTAAARQKAAAQGYRLLISGSSGTRY
jgi:hypothetical protein